MLLLWPTDAEFNVDWICCQTCENGLIYHALEKKKKKTPHAYLKRSLFVYKDWSIIFNFRI